MEEIKKRIKLQIAKIQADLDNMSSTNLHEFLNRLVVFNNQTTRQIKVFKTTGKKVLASIAENYFTKFPNKKIALIGDTRMKISGVERIFNEFCIYSKNYEFLDEYLDGSRIGDKLKNFFNNKLYVGILMGPIAHSIRGNTGTNVQFETDIPIIKVSIGNKRPKITNDSLRNAITELIQKLN